MKNIVVSSYFDLFGGSVVGSEQRVCQFVQWLEQEYRVHCVVTGPFLAGPKVHSIGLDTECATENRAFRRLRNVRKRMASLCRTAPCHETSPELERIIDHQAKPIVRDRLRDLCMRLDPVAILYEYAWSMMPLYEVAKECGVPIIVDTHDCLSQRTQTARQFGETVRYPFSPEREFSTLSNADAVLAIQAAEAITFREAMPDANIMTVPHSAGDFAGIKTDASVQGRVLLVASASDHNVDSLHGIVHEVWPAVVAACPDATLDVCGTVCKRFEQDTLPPSVRLHGVVDQLESFYRDAQIVLNAPRFGSGLKIKAVEAIRYGKCLVCTPTGVQGMPQDPVCFLIAEFDEIANRVIELLKNPVQCQSLAARTREYYDAHFSPDVCYAPLGRYLNDLKQRSVNASPTANL